MLMEFAGHMIQVMLYVGGADKMKRVYLSGGTVTGWQNYIISRVEGVDFYNPAQFKLGSLIMPELRLFGPMDKTKIRECDVLFGYLEASNPTPINVALELGYAKGLGKITVLCNEWTEDRFKSRQLKCQETTDAMKAAMATWFRPHYVDLMNSWADFVETDFGLAIELLKKVVNYTN